MQLHHNKKTYVSEASKKEKQKMKQEMHVQKMNSQQRMQDTKED
jgi:hypothetical protein